jgi:hypothetical protein
MATSIKLKGDIKKIEAAIKSKATPKTLVPKLEAQLDKLKSDLASLSSPKPKKGVTKTKVLSSLQKLKAKVKATKSLSGYKKSGIDIKKDAEIPARALGRRVSKGLKANGSGTKAQNKGNVYYEYRLNRADVKQPPKRYPKLEDGGMMAKGGLTKDSIIRTLTSDKSQYFLKKDGRGYILYISPKGALNSTFHDKFNVEDLGNEGTKRKYRLSKISNDMMADGGKTEEEPKVIRGYSDDEAYEYAKGGMVEHGLKVGDLIVGEGEKGTDMDGYVFVSNNGKNFVVHLNSGHRSGSMKHGGRTTSAINRDRAYKSNQPWEQNYSRKSNPKNPKYKSSSDFFEGGGEMHRLFEDGEV